MTIGREVNLIKNYPYSKRDISGRLASKTDEDRRIARQFDEDFFDGDRRYGYGGYNYNPKYWTPVVPDFMKNYGLTRKSKILDVGCGKGFFLYDFMRLIPGLSVSGVDISNYAIYNALPEVKPYLQVNNAKNLPFEDNYFDLVISINTIHNLVRSECMQAIREIERVSKGSSYIVVDAYKTESEQKRMKAWNLTAKTFMHVEDWKKFFSEAGYTGDYYWFIP